MVKPFFYLFIISAIILSGFACSSNNADKKNSQEARLLLFSKTEGFRHSSIPDGIAALEKLADEHNFEISTTEDASQFSEENLSSYQAVIFLNTTGDVLNDQQQQALKSFVEGGKGFMGIHSATDTEYEWSWYGQTIGAYFKSHPKIQQAELKVIGNTHPAIDHLPDTWTRTDEWYNFRDIQGTINPLINLDESTYEGGENGEFHPVAWTHDIHQGRVFYTAGGHTPESYSDSLFVQHLLGGIEYVLGRET